MSKFDRFIAAGLALAYLLMLAAPVYAAPVPVTATYPTKNTDGSAIPATGAGSIVSWRVEYSTCTTANPVFGVKAGELTVTAPGTVANFTLGPGTYCFRSYMKNTFGNESAPTNIATTTVLAPTPEPGSITVQAIIAGTNFSPVFRFDEHGGPLPRAAGLIEAGATCTGPVLFKREGRSYRRVAAKDVDVWFATSNGRLAAACG